MASTAATPRIFAPDEFARAPSLRSRRQMLHETETQRVIALSQKDSTARDLALRLAQVTTERLRVPRLILARKNGPQ